MFLIFKLIISIFISNSRYFNRYGWIILLVIKQIVAVNAILNIGENFIQLFGFNR